MKYVSITDRKTGRGGRELGRAASQYGSWSALNESRSMVELSVRTNGRAEGSKSTPEAADDEAQRYGSGILLLGSGPLATNY